MSLCPPEKKIRFEFFDRLKNFFFTFPNAALSAPFCEEDISQELFAQVSKRNMRDISFRFLEAVSSLKTFEEDVFV